MARQICRWGIMGTAAISRKNWEGIWNSGNGIVQAVASRSPEKAKTYIHELQQVVPFAATPAACSYEELLQRSDLDAVYIPLPTGLREAWIIKAAQAGKHVLSEKPCTLSAAALREILAICREHSVQFMDGVMFMHSARLPAIRAVLDSDHGIGSIRRMNSHFSFLGDQTFLNHNIRSDARLEPFGCLGDLGWYCIRLFQWGMSNQLPSQVSCQILNATDRDDGEGVPLEATAELRYPGNVTGGFYCSFTADQQQTATITGTAGVLSMDDFVLPAFGAEAGFRVVKNDFQISGPKFNMVSRERRVTVPEFSNNHPTSQETNLFRNFAQLVNRGEPDHSWGDVALKTQIVLEACMESGRNGGQPVTLPN